MTIQYINTGTSPNKGDGDTLRFAFDKVNENFLNISNFINYNADTTSTNILPQDLYTTSSPIFLNLTLDGDLTNVVNVTSSGKVYIDQTGGIGFNDYPDTSFRADYDVDSYGQVILKNHNGGTNASTDLVILNDIGTDTSGYIDVGINSSYYSQEEYSVTGPNDGYLYVNGGNLVLGTQSPGTQLIFHAGGTENNSAGGSLDDYAWHFNRSVQVQVSTPGTLNFTVTNPSDDPSASAAYQAINDLGNLVSLGIHSSTGAEGNIGPGEAFLHTHDTSSNIHIGNKSSLFLYADSNNGYDGTATISLLNNAEYTTKLAGNLVVGNMYTKNMSLTSNLAVHSDVDGFAGSSVHNHNSGTNAVSAMVFGNDQSMQSPVSMNYLFVGMVSSTYANPYFPLVEENDSLIYNDGGHLVLGTLSPNTNLKFFVGGSNILSAEASSSTWSYSAHLIPSSDLTYDLGSTSSQWRSLYVGTSTIYLGGTALSVSGGNLTVDGIAVADNSSSTSTTYIPTTPADWIGSPTVGTVSAGLDELASRVSTFSITTSTLVNGSHSLILGSTGNITFPDGGALRISQAPVSSKGKLSDTAGLLAVNTSSIFYCISDYIALPNSATANISGGDGVNSGIAAALSVVPSVGWTIEYNGQSSTINQVTLQGSWYVVFWDTVINIPTGGTFTYGPDPLPNIWVKQNWSSTGSW